MKKERAAPATATVRQVQHNLAGVLRAVEAGEEVVIRRRSRPIARIVPIGPVSNRRVDWAPLDEWRARVFAGGKVRGKPASECVLEGRGGR